MHAARSRAPQIGRRRLAGEGVGSAKIISTAQTLSRASALLHRQTFMLRDRVRRKSVGAGLLAKALGPRKLYRLPKRYRGQARSYTVLHSCCEIACAANPVGAGLLAKAVGSQKMSTDEAPSRASALLHRPALWPCHLLCRKPAVGARLPANRSAWRREMLNESTSSLCAAPLQSSRVSTSSNSISNTRSECGLMCAPMDLSP